MLFQGSSRTTATPKRPCSAVVTDAGVGCPFANATQPLTNAPTNMISNATLVRRPARRDC